jgi:outer membrane protein insertion porin family
MRTEPPGPASRAAGGSHGTYPRARERVGRATLMLMLLSLLPGTGSSRVAAQAPLFLIDADTRVSSIDLSFVETETLERESIRTRIGLTEPGFLAAVQGVFAFLPLINPPAAHPFSPLELGRDAVRIEQYYREHGFLETAVAYEVRLDTTSNSVDVTFRITEGRPLRLDTIDVAITTGVTALDSTLATDWHRFVSSMSGDTGIRVGEVERVRLRSRPLDWLRGHGYAFASVRDTLVIDSADARAALRLRVEPGPRARVDSVLVEGRQSLSYNTVRRGGPAPGLRTRHRPARTVRRCARSAA